MTWALVATMPRRMRKPVPLDAFPLTSATEGSHRATIWAVESGAYGPPQGPAGAGCDSAEDDTGLPPSAGFEGRPGLAPPSDRTRMTIETRLKAAAPPRAA